MKQHRLGFFGSFVYCWTVTTIVHITVARRPTFLDSVWWTITVMSGIWTAAVVFYLSCAIVGGVLHFIRGFHGNSTSNGQEQSSSH